MGELPLEKQFEGVISNLEDVHLQLAAASENGIDEDGKTKFFALAGRLKKTSDKIGGLAVKIEDFAMGIDTTALESERRKTLAMQFDAAKDLAPEPLCGANYNLGKETELLLSILDDA